MERFNNEQVKEYSVLAKYYDDLLSDKDSLYKWIDVFDEEKYRTILELASGTAICSSLLKNKGKDIIASDISKDMKDVASLNYDGEYLLLDMTDFNLDKKFDLIICICDSFNYLNKNQILNFFKCCYKHLNDNGRLIFDMHSIKRLDEFSNEYIEEGYLDNVGYQFSIISDKDAKLINENITFYEENRTIHESHIQHVYSVNEIVDIMRDLMYNVEARIDFIKDEKDLIIGRLK